jgi:hypothetical protein
VTHEPGIQLIDRCPDHGGRMLTSFGQGDRKTPTVFGIYRTVEIAPYDERVDQLPTSACFETPIWRMRPVSGAPVLATAPTT